MSSVNKAAIVASGGPHDLSTAFGSNEVRLRLREWGLVVVVISILIWSVPRLWKRAIPFTVPDDYRVPYRLSNDYWTYNRWLETAAADDAKIFLVGDSVAWGEYVTPQDTFNQFLNREDHSTRFVNAGLNGTHPLALEGLVQYHAAAVHDRRVILHCNLLWLSSRERDLQTDKETDFNHPDLVPQLVPRVPAYRANGDQRLGVIMDRVFSFRALVNHFRIAWLDGQDLPNWSIEHPYDNPLSGITLAVQLPQGKPHSQPIAWTERGITRQDLPWVTADSSLQWQAMKRTIDLLRRRNNQLFVVVGPFNDHLLTDPSRRQYEAVLRDVSAWLESHQVPYSAPASLESTLYGDASHPLAAGYQILAHDLYQNRRFRQWLEK